MDHQYFILFSGKAFCSNFLEPLSFFGFLGWLKADYGRRQEIPPDVAVLGNAHAFPLRDFQELNQITFIVAGAEVPWPASRPSFS